MCHVPAKYAGRAVIPLPAGIVMRGSAVGEDGGFLVGRGRGISRTFYNFPEAAMYAQKSANGALMFQKGYFSGIVKKGKHNIQIRMFLNYRRRRSK